MAEEETPDTTAKDPAALFYIDKWIAGTQGMSGSAKGWYLDLILYQFDKGGIPNSIDEMSGICRVRPSEYAEFEQVFKQVLEQKFDKNESGQLENGFAKQIIKGRKAFKEKKSLSGKWSYVKKIILKKYKNTTSEQFKVYYKYFDFSIDLKNEQVLEQVLEHIFELYINTNANGNKDLKIKKEAIEKLVFSDESYVEELQSIHQDKNLKQAFNECYIHHSNAPNPPAELWQWRQKLNSWLTGKRPDWKDKKQTPKKKFTIEDLTQ